MQVRVGTFNLENLFLRYKFGKTIKGTKPAKKVDPDEFVKKGGTILGFSFALEAFGPIDPVQRSMTAKVVVENEPEFLVCCEVENLDALRQFNEKYLKAKRFPHAILIDSRDPRLIDVGVLSRHPITRVRSYMDETNDSGTRIFARDCLEVDIAPASGKTLTIYANHLTSMLSDKDGHRRLPQARKVHEIVRTRFGDQPAPYLIAGDLNAPPETEEIKELLKLPVANVVKRMSAAEQWTHAYKNKPGPHDAELQQLDYLLVSQSVAGGATTKPTIERRGLSGDIKNYTGSRFAGVKGDGTEASDHCGVFFDVTL